MFNTTNKSTQSYQASFSYTPFSPPFWLTNTHLQTMLPKLISKPINDYRRVLVKDSFGSNHVAYDYYDVADSKNTNGQYQKPIVVVFHGLEGSSSSHYVSTLARQIHQHGWHFVAPHYRGCGGVPIEGDVFYNAGDTTEIHHMLSVLQQSYQTIYAIGISLGGNLLAKYLGERGDKALCASAVVVSAPVDLGSSSIAMERFMGRYIYTPYLLKPLVTKALSTKLSQEEMAAINASKRICDFDHVFTAPRHGFRSMNDYYRQASSLPYLIDICTPTLIITAKDDPFLGMTATPQDVSSSVTLIDTRYGGHIGFVNYCADKKGLHKLDVSWLPTTSLQFFNQHLANA